MFLEEPGELSVEGADRIDLLIRCVPGTGSALYLKNERAGTAVVVSLSFVVLVRRKLVFEWCSR